MLRQERISAIGKGREKDGLREHALAEANPAIKGSMSAFGYSYARDKLTDEQYNALRLPKFEGLRGDGGPLPAHDLFDRTLQLLLLQTYLA